MTFSHALISQDFDPLSFQTAFHLSLTPSESIQSSVIVITHHPYKTTAANAIYNWTQRGGMEIPFLGALKQTMC